MPINPQDSHRRVGDLQCYLKIQPLQIQVQPGTYGLDVTLLQTPVTIKRRHLSRAKCRNFIAKMKSLR